MIRTIKKKDSIQLSIFDDKKNDLNIKVIPKENNRVTTSVIKIQSIQNMKIDLPKVIHSLLSCRVMIIKKCVNRCRTFRTRLQSQAKTITFVISQTPVN